MNQLLQILKLIPLKIRVSLYYFFKFRRLLNFKQPKRFSEKIQIRKLNLLPEYTQLSDKFLVRKFVEARVGSQYLINLIGVYDCISEVDFALLPEKFVIKTNHGSGHKHLEIVKNKADKDIEILRRKFFKAIKEDYIGALLGENQYDAINRKVVIEELIENGEHDLEDFKFHLFNSQSGFIQIDVDRFKNHSRILYDLDFNPINCSLEYPKGNYQLPPAEQLAQLKQIAIKLSEGFDYVRVDLYLVKGKIYFGEMTFTPGSGFELFTPEEYDLKFGQMWQQKQQMLI
ncbi:ATP-grasp fold amidoligase family protein [Thalassomonas haliotis]|uniref:Teichuronopeptide biosynthesis TupA-like protein n=1 Tax=Thalassomonas haliotis TaxID=485448 RepID=A0ABY7VIE5_9GAMM|nr:ATP-grasp fold amidoligase family protein [Thalassomonas haliotis]WDE13288.1 hypothetical protein H3N35_07565 [Thalassomonas haliotis]